jgi:hypothetical protein
VSDSTGNGAPGVEIVLADVSSYLGVPA